ncbi:D-aminoacyl-tRNA deacylase [Rhodococcus sp. X156]|uniref:D-aminoacyl-tRNA deacylase n=1 Tax=Rhodococcus sp. X156 TaxID=2499145 RepID=UPI000FD92C2C|nr:D-aminoacyl-tRNA deacylase [Rhodococcus sp. X156]
MRAVISRVSSASVTVDGELVAELAGPGLLVLLAVARDDQPAAAATMARKIAELRLLREERSVADTGAGVLVVSQFTLYGDTRKGRRPSWSAAAAPEHATALIQRVLAELAQRGVPAATGRFGADMAVASVNDGPFTVLVDC